MTHSAGFKPKRRTFVLEFEDDDLTGFTVKARSVSLGEFLEFTDLAAQSGALQAGVSALDDLAGGISAVRELFTRFAGVITEWNLLGDDDQPVPVGLDGLLGLEFPVVQALIGAWMSGAADVTGPLGGTSPRGGTGPTTDPGTELELAGLSSLAS